MLILTCICTCLFVCFSKQKTAYELRISDWSSDVCSSDLAQPLAGKDREHRAQRQALIIFEEQRRHPKGKAERKGHDRDPAVVGEEIGRKDMQRALVLARGCWTVAERSAQKFDAGARVAAARHPFRNEMEIPVEIGGAHVSTPVTNSHLECPLLLEKKKEDHK